MLVQKRTLEQARLYCEREAAIDELSHLREVMQHEVDLDPDEADAQITEQQTASILVAMLEQKVQDIDSALASIKLGQYHSCERCGGPIEPERLAAKPSARYCIACQEVVEKVIHEACLAQTADAEELSPFATFEV
jgi:RNA polymerase-binding transcription factor DksA